ncbi:hypothetical protein [Clostridium cibarium]|uniref:Butirosin biosynthesis protein H N-terminal domain-containing protein n=1 Tax=Clostridium cibarium TaxID=2762247 RepID=A0ABR8PY22_9CLOT|nr:hypothetical protein [Clostridium cibarium]MBD7913069.1 hypothetical protein [Clostridium cibarium]
MGKRELKQIQPFDDIFYRHCYYNPLLTALRYYGKDVTPFIVNDVNVYKIKKKNESKCNVQFYSRYVGVKKDDEILSELGIEVKNHLYTTDIITTIIQSINEDIPLIIYADAYYCKHYELFYKNSHHKHFMLVFGYDEELNIFKIVDVNNEHISVKNIKFETLKTAYEGYYKFLQMKSDDVNYSQVILKENCSNKLNHNYISVFRSNMLKNKELMLNNTEVLKHINSNLNEILAEESGIDKNINELLESFFFIIVIKKTEKYRIQKLFGDEFFLVDPLDKIIKEWEKIKIKIIKYNSIRNIKVKTMFNHINKIYVLESYYNKELFNYIEKIK